MSSIRPVVLLAFADARRDLASLKHEGWSLRDQFEALKRHGVVADVVVEERALLDRIYSVLQRHRDRIAIFHFGGHADADSLLLESALGPGAAHAEGLATLLGRQRGLKLVFLNGCSTRPQVARLLDAGVPAVIATARPIDDALAVRFAVAFYQALTTGHEDARGKVAGGCGIASAFAQAEGLAQAAGGGKLRDLGDESAAHDIFDDRGLPWNVFYRPGAEEVARWTLFDDDPMFGLPELPGDIGRPPEPFRRLEWFGREHARIFFGRGRAIRGLYDLVTRPAAPAEARVLLYYGQTGVGKTSVLAAGLLPRLEVSHQVRYLRRSADAGLLGTLRDELDKSFDPFDLGRAWAAIEASGQPLVVVLDQAEEAYTRPRVAPPSADGAEALTRSWIDPEAEIRELIEAVRVAFDPTRPDRPAGRLILGFRKEWLDEFEKACKAAGLAFQPVPLGSLDRAGVIEAIEGPARDPRNQVWLAEPAPGDPSIAEFIADDLLRTLADPKKNAESPVAPTLQILLTRMWADARERDRDRPTFDRPLYTALKSQGFQLGEVLDQQLAAIREADPAAVDLGLILDLLEHFTTPLGTAAARTRAEVVARYPRQASDRLDALIRRCQEGYLLVETGVGTDSAATYRLVHDTLAPLVRDRFQRSLALVPRARRILEKRALEWSDGCEGPPLDAHDLSIVESAAAVLPAWTKDEERLLESSREAERRRLADEVERQRQLLEAREREEQARAERQAETELRLKQQEEANLRQQESNRRLRQRAYGLLCGLAAALIFAGLAVWQWGEAADSAAAQKKARKEADDSAVEAKTQAKKAEESAKLALEKAHIAESRRLANLADTVLPKRLDTAMLLALEANQAADTLEARGSLQHAFTSRPEVVRLFAMPEGRVTDMVLGTDGRVTALYSDGVGDSLKTGVVVSGANGERMRLDPPTLKEGRVTGLALGPNGRIAASYGNVGTSGGVVLFGTDGQRLRHDPLVFDKGFVTRMTSGPGGQIAVIYVVGELSGPPPKLRDLNLRDLVNKKAVVSIFDPINERSRPEPVVVEEGDVTHVAFGPNGQFAAAYERRTPIGNGVKLDSGVVLFGADGERARPEPLVAGKDHFEGIDFGPDGQFAVAYARFDNVSRIYTDSAVFLFGADGERARPEPLIVKDGSVQGVAFGPDGRLAVAYSNPGGYTGGGVVLFGADGERARSGPLTESECMVTGVAFGPDGRIAVAYERNNLIAEVSGVDNGVVLFGADGERARPEPLSVKNGDVQGVAFGPDGQLAVVYNVDSVDYRSDGRVVLLGADGRPSWPEPVTVQEVLVSSVTFSTDGGIAVGYGAGKDAPGGVVLFGADGERSRIGPLLVSEGNVTDVAFSPSGRLAASYESGYSGGVVLFGAGGQRSRPEPLIVGEGAVNGVAFGLGDRLAVTYDKGASGGGVVLFDSTGRRLRPEPLAVGKSVKGVAFGPDGHLAVGYLGGVALFDADGERVQDDHLVMSKKYVEAVDFGPHGRLAAAPSDGLVLFRSDGERLWPDPLAVNDTGSIVSLAFGEDGRVATTYQNENITN